MEWYVLFVHTGKEDLTQKWLEYYFDDSDLHPLVPKRKLMEKKQGKVNHVLKTIFPGYVFIKTDMDLAKYYTIKNIPEVIKFLGDNAYYSKVSHDEMSVILKFVDDSGIINCSMVLIENSRVTIKEGPLCRMEGIIKKIDMHRRRAKVEFTILGDTKLVDIGIDFLQITH